MVPFSGGSRGVLICRDKGPKVDLEHESCTHWYGCAAATSNTGPSEMTRMRQCRFYSVELRGGSTRIRKCGSSVSRPLGEQTRCLYQACWNPSEKHIWRADALATEDVELCQGVKESKSMAPWPWLGLVGAAFGCSQACICHSRVIRA